MTRRSKREIERAVDALDAPSNGEQIFVVSIGGDPDVPSGWLSPEVYEEHYGDPPESGFEYNIEWGDA